MAVGGRLRITLLEGVGAITAEVLMHARVAITGKIGYLNFCCKAVLAFLKNTGLGHCAAMGMTGKAQGILCGTSWVGIA